MSMPSVINVNTASAKELTQLPGVGKNVAYKIVNRRKRNGYFTDWEELLEVKEFPEEALDKVKRRATLLPIDGIRPEEFGPRRTKAAELARRSKKPKGYTKAIRTTRSSDRLKRSA